MSNSPLVTYTKLSPNHSGQRKQKIDTITIHCVVGQLTLKTLGNVFADPARKASSNYGVSPDGNIGMFVEEKNRSWCSSSNANDQRAVTIEVASDTTAPYKITDAAMKGLINLCIDVCKRNGIPELKWKADKSLIGQIDKQNMTVHRWFAAKACPGDYIYSHMDYIVSEVNKVLKPAPASQPKPISNQLPYAVKITAPALNYRGGPGTNYGVRGIVHKNEIYTIVEEASGKGATKWGKLKSGAGWISLDFCVKTR